MPELRNDRIMRVLLVAGLLSVPLTVGAEDRIWDGNCGDSPPQRWHCSCSEPNIQICNGGGTTNWVSDTIPGAADNATIAPGSGLISIDNDTTVNSVNAGSGLKLSFYHLTIEGTGSTIQGLELTSAPPSRTRADWTWPTTVISKGWVDSSRTRAS